MDRFGHPVDIGIIHSGYSGPWVVTRGHIITSSLHVAWLQWQRSLDLMAKVRGCFLIFLEWQDGMMVEGARVSLINFVDP